MNGRNYVGEQDTTGDMEGDGDGEAKVLQSFIGIPCQEAYNLKPMAGKPSEGRLGQMKASKCHGKTEYYLFCGGEKPHLASEMAQFSKGSMYHVALLIVQNGFMLRDEKQV